MKWITTAFFFSLCSFVALAQAPQAIPFQAVAKSADGYIWVSENATVNFKIRSGSAAGPIVFEENHDVVTSSLGVVSVSIGNGALVSGSFSALANANSNYFLEVNFNVASQSFPLGVKKLNPVPHAKYANGERFRISEVGDTLFKGGNQGIIIPGISGANN